MLRILKLAEEQGLSPPEVFGVPEDLLFALPAEAVRAYLKGPFPGWKELIVELNHPGFDAHRLLVCGL